MEPTPDEVVDEDTNVGPVDELHGVHAVVLEKHEIDIPEVVLDVRVEDVTIPDNFEGGRIAL